MFGLPWGDPPGKTRLWWLHDWHRHTSWHQAHLHQPEHTLSYMCLFKEHNCRVYIKKSSTLQSTVIYNCLRLLPQVVTTTAFRKQKPDNHILKL